MQFFGLLPVACFFAVAANAQDSSSTSNSNVLVLSGTASEAATPSGSYLSYTSTRTRTSSSSAISTAAIISTISSGSTTRTTTLGSTTIFGYGTMVAGNSSRSGSTSSNSQLILSGRPTSTISSNSTSNSTSTSSTATATNTTPCNNYPEFCSRSYGNITEVSAHNSPFVKAGNAAANQALSVTAQLNDGIRLVQGQMHLVNSTPHFCHTSCSVLDAGPITQYLSTVKSWVDDHPYDVVTILLGNGAFDNGSYPLIDAYAPYIEQTGLQNYAYIPPKIPMGLNDWPTLASMIITGKRVVIFMDYNANQTAYPWILDEFSQMWETPFDPTNNSFPCTVQRPPGLNEADSKNRLYMTNHNLNYDITLLGNSLLVPSIPTLNITNAAGNQTGMLGLTAQNCNATWGFPPKFLNVDYYNVGNGSVFEVAAKWNNVTYTRECCGVSISAATTFADIVGRSASLLAVCVVLTTWLLM